MEGVFIMVVCFTIEGCFTTEYCLIMLCCFTKQGCFITVENIQRRSKDTHVTMLKTGATILRQERTTIHPSMAKGARHDGPETS